MVAELLAFSALKQWLKDNGGNFHGDVQFKFAGTQILPTGVDNID